MNKTKILAITYAVLITLIIIFPPVHFVAGSRGTFSRGFSAIWMIHGRLSINIPFLLIELFAVTAICAVIYFVFIKNGKNHEIQNKGSETNKSQTTKEQPKKHKNNKLVIFYVVFGGLLFNLAFYILLKHLLFFGNTFDISRLIRDATTVFGLTIGHTLIVFLILSIIRFFKRQWPSFLIPSIIITTLTFIVIILANIDKYAELAEPQKQSKRDTIEQFNEEYVGENRERDVLSKLSEKMSIEFINTPLRDIMIFFQYKTKLNFVLDEDYADTIVNIKLNDVSVSTILKYILPKELDLVINDDGVVQITNKDYKY